MDKKSNKLMFRIDCKVLTAVFVILKLFGIIRWSWLLVLAPLWMPPAVAFILAILLRGD